MNFVHMNTYIIGHLPIARMKFITPSTRVYKFRVVYFNQRSKALMFPSTFHRPHQREMNANQSATLLCAKRNTCSDSIDLLF